MFKKMKNLPFEKILAVTSMIILFFITSLALYDKIQHEQEQDVIVKIKLEDNQDPFVTLPQIMPNSSVIQKVREVSKSQNEYIMTIRTKKQKKEILDWIINSGGVENAELH